MSVLRTREDTDYRVTAQQIAKLERGLLSLRQDSNASPQAIEAIASIQYQEILRLRAELDAAMGFPEAPCDLEVSLSGPTIGLGIISASAIAKFVTNLRTALQSLTAYLMTGQLPRTGRLPGFVTQLTDLQLVGTASGSMNLRLAFPQPRDHSTDGLEAVKQALHLMLETVDWSSSTAGIESLHAKVEDVILTGILLEQVKRLTPTPKSVVQRVAFSSHVTDKSESHVLSHKSLAKLQNAVETFSERRIWVTEVGRIRAVDIDRRSFTLRQRPGGQQPLRCTIPSEIMARSIDYLVNDAAVAVEGILQFDNLGRPSSMSVQRIYDTEYAE